MAQEGYLEEHVHQENDVRLNTPMTSTDNLSTSSSIECIRRLIKATYLFHIVLFRAVKIVAAVSFHSLMSMCSYLSVSPIKLARTNVEYIAGGMLKVDTTFQEPDTKLFRGLKSTLEHLPAPHVESSSDGTVIYVPDHFPPGSIMVFATTMLNIGADLDAFILTGADDALKEVDLVDLNAILFRCEAEERDVTCGLALTTLTSNLIFSWPRRYLYHSQLW